MNWIYYILEANLYLLAFYAFYRLFLSKETFYMLNRYYLIAGTLLAFVLPFVQAGFLFNLLPDSWSSDNATAYAASPGSPVAASYLSFSFLIAATYFGIACMLTIRVLKDLLAVLYLAYRAKRNMYRQVKYFELKGGEVAFSFFNFLFINPNAAEKDVIIRHEQVHMRQFHSLDTLFLEIIHAFSWFNPVLFFVKNDLNTLHEFIADELTSSGPLVGKHAYAMLLIHNSFGLPLNPLTKPIYNPSSLKKRITMLNQPKSASRARLKLLFLLPLTCAIICTSTLAFSKNYKLIDLYAGRQTGLQTDVQDTTKRIPPPLPIEAPKHPKAPNQHRFPPPPPPREPRMPRAAKAPRAPKATVTPATPASPETGAKESVMPVPPPPPPAPPTKKY
jgi:hypothetical protein